MKHYYELSEQQKELFVSSNIAENCDLYTLSFTINFQNILKPLCLHKAIQNVFDNNTILKSRIINYDGEIKLCVENEAVEIEYIDDINEISSPIVITLDSNKLYKIKVLYTKNNKHIVYFAFHHIIIDGNSIKLFCEELRKSYNKEVDLQMKGTICLAESNAQIINYFDYVNYQNIFSKSIYYSRQRDYQRFVFNPQYEYLNFPGKRRKPHNFYRKSIESNIFDTKILNNIQKYAFVNKVQPNSIFLSALLLAISNYCNAYDIIIGCIASGRENNVLFKNIIGFFSNIMPLRFGLEPKMLLKDFIEYVNNKLQEGIENQDYSYGKIVSQSHTNTEVRSPVQVIFNMQKSYEITKTWEGIDNVLISLSESSNLIYDLIVDIKYSTKDMIISIEYSNELISSSFINKFLKNYEYILNNILSNINKPLEEIPCINPDEFSLLTQEFNNNECEIKWNHMFDILKNVFESNLDKIAVVDNKTEYTYKEVKERICGVATYLGERERDNEMIGILLERSASYIISLFAILGINAVFVPIDSTMPISTVLRNVNTCNIKRIITSYKFIEKAEELKNVIRNIEIINIDTIMPIDKKYEVSTISPQDLAYVLFTSGTTGEAKGAMITHENLVNLYLLYKKFFQLDNKNKILQFASITFDASIWEIFMAFYHGATLYIPSKEVILDTELFCEYINQHGIDTMTLPPIYARELVNYELKTIKNVISAGSISYDGDFRQWNDEVRFYNAYGLTETTICITVSHVNKSIRYLYRSELPVGRPVPNTKLYILDKWKRIMPVEAEGELYISGKSLSAGYINNDILTKEKFINNLFFNDNKMYQTGDTALWIEDGSIIITGRNDDQIKMKGIRIELSAIENIYLRHSKIKQFCVIPYKNEKNEMLKAFYMSDEILNESDLRKYGEIELPEYMIPQLFLRVEKFPVTSSGKVDKNSLLKLHNYTSVEESDKTLFDSSFSITAKISSLVSNITRKQIDENVNFFELGLDSYSLLLLRNEIQDKLSINLRIPELFKYTTISALVDYIENSNKIRK